MKTYAARSLLTVALLAGIGVTAEARGRKFSCPLDDKRACMSVQQVYDATNNGARLNASGQSVPVAEVPQRAAAVTPEAVSGTPVAVPNRCCEPSSTAVTVKGESLAVASPVVYPNAEAMQPASGRNEMVLRTTRDEPYRTPAKVMRIYVASWEDDSGDLHMGGYLFSELEPRKWTVGVRQTASNEGFRLLTVTQPTRDAAQEATTGKGDATAQANRAD